MKIAKYGKDVLDVDDRTLDDIHTDKIHLIRFTFNNPTASKIRTVLKNNKETNRFIIQDNIKLYNNTLKEYKKKYYVVNGFDPDLITFFRRNNKCLLDFTKLNDFQLNYIFSSTETFYDILSNVEVIWLSNKLFKDLEDIHKDLFDILNEWNGNVII